MSDEQRATLPSVTELMSGDELEVASTMIIGPKVAVLITDDEVIVTDQSGERRYRLVEREGP